MTNDELLSKLLDGTLSPAEKDELHSRMAVSPDFSDEVREMQMVEDLLAKRSRKAEVLPGDTYLRAVEDRMATALRNGGVAATGIAPGNKPALETARFASRSLPAVLALLLLLSSGAYFVFSGGGEEQRAERHSSDGKVHAQASQTSRIAESPVETATQTAATGEGETHTRGQAAGSGTPGTAEAAPERNPADALQAEEQNESAAATQESAASTARENEERPERAGRMSISDPVNPAVTQELKRLQTLYNSSGASGDQINRAQLAKQIGSLYRQSGNYQAGREYLTTALALAQKLKITQLEAHTLGELALLDEKTGRHREAMEKLAQCISLLEAQGGESGRWKAELERLQNL